MRTPHQHRINRQTRIAATALLLGLGLWDAGAAATEENGTPLTSRTTHVGFASQMRVSSLGQKYTVSTYDVPTPDAVPHILAIDSDNHVWFSESGGRFAGK